jgi:hypothetical protein
MVMQTMMANQITDATDFEAPQWGQVFSSLIYDLGSRHDEQIVCMP